MGGGDRDQNQPPPLEMHAIIIPTVFRYSSNQYARQRGGKEKRNENLNDATPLAIESPRHGIKI